jgi:hypothetical protein
MQTVVRSQAQARLIATLKHQRGTSAGSLCASMMLVAGMKWSDLRNSFFGYPSVDTAINEEPRKGTALRT